MTCPAACTYNAAGVTFWYAHTTKLPKIPNITTFEVPEDISIIERASVTAHALERWISSYIVSAIGIEDYAFAATGRVFHIGEHAGVLKYVLHHKGWKLDTIPPTVIKKFATGKGNADKHKMTVKFLEVYPDANNWIFKFFPRFTEATSPAKSPLADLADAYWIAKYMFEKQLDNANSIS